MKSWSKFLSLALFSLFVHFVTRDMLLYLVGTFFTGILEPQPALRLHPATSLSHHSYWESVATQSLVG